MEYPMNRPRVKLLLMLSAALFFVTCEKLEPEADNPLDPDNPDYDPPEVLISEGPAEGEIVDTSAVTFQWTGNELVTSYRYRFDSEVWSDWTSNTSASYYYLDEGDYSFSVQSQYETGDTSVVLNVSFVVDAVTGPALMFYPRRHEAQVGETVTFQILAEEVSNLAAAEFSISYDPDEIEITAIYEGSIFTDLGNVFFLVDNGSEGEATISTAVWGESSPSAEGTGVLAALEVKAKVTGSLVVSFDGSEVFRDPDNNDVSINETVGGLVVVE
jgi:plastocyanin